MNEHKELELKYLTNKDFKLARLLNLLTKNGFIILDMHDVINIDKYFDTPNKDLLKDGASLRIRIVNNKELGIVVDKNSKLEGRGTYICKSEDCLNKVIKSKKLERALKGKIGEEVYNKLKGVIIEG